MSITKKLLSKESPSRNQWMEIPLDIYKMEKIAVDVTQQKDICAA